jgi:NAD-dependent SIR2 family protein deacetylase
LFDASLFRDPESTKVFYTFMGELSVLSDKARLTKTHDFISYLEGRGTLLRWYTQNIDGLEEKALTLKENSKKKNSKIIQLHGNLQSLKCNLCSHKLPLVKEHVEIYFKKGVPPPCPSCDSKAQVRSALGKRAISVGSLRPDVVLYNEHHDQGTQDNSYI